MLTSHPDGTFLPIRPRGILILEVSKGRMGRDPRRAAWKDPH